MIENVKRDRLLAALIAAVWLQEEIGVTVALIHHQVADNKLYVDGNLDFNRLVDDVLAALDVSQEPVKAG